MVTLGAALVGIVSGAVSHYIVKKDGALRIILSVAAAHLVGSVIVKSIGLFVYYDWLVLWRIPTYAIIASVEAMLICLMNKNKTFNTLIKKGDKK